VQQHELLDACVVLRLSIVCSVALFRRFADDNRDLIGIKRILKAFNQSFVK
jgi:hypothetical protein